jgi:hypothetical protein
MRPTPRSVRLLGAALASLLFQSAIPNTIHAAERDSGLHLGGAVRLNYSHREWDDRYDSAGLVDFDTARIDIAYDRGAWLGSAQYRYYHFRNASPTHFLHHAWIGRRLSEATQLHVGVNPIPFGILPFASNNYFFSLGYYVGLEDSYNLGAKVLHRRGPLDLQFGFYPRDGGHWHGASDASARYTFNIVPAGERRNRERDTAVGRIAYTFKHAEDANSVLGVSLLGGRVPNETTGRDGNRYAGALHLEGRYGRWGIMLQAARYRVQLENPPGADSRIAFMGAYDAPYQVATHADLYVANVSYRLTRKVGPLSHITFYSNYSLLDKHEAGFRDSHQQVFGVSFNATDKVFVYVDYLFGRQHPYVGPNFTSGLAAGGKDGGWHRRVNVSIGYYF